MHTLLSLSHTACSFVRGGPTLTTFFVCFVLVDGGDDSKTTTSGPSSARRRNAISRWRADDCPTLNAG